MLGSEGAARILQGNSAKSEPLVPQVAQQCQQAYLDLTSSLFLLRFINIHSFLLFRYLLHQ